MPSDPAQIGRIGEQLAARHLEAEGCAIVDRNWRPATRQLRGELDIVASDGAVIVFCEVKTRRRASAGSPAEAVDRRKHTQLRRLAAAWLLASPHTGAPVRFDVIAVSWPPGGGRAEIAHTVGIDG